MSCTVTLLMQYFCGTLTKIDTKQGLIGRVLVACTHYRVTCIVASMDWMSVRGYMERIALRNFMQILNQSSKQQHIEENTDNMILVSYMYLENGIHSWSIIRFIDICKQYKLLAFVKAAREACKYIRKCTWKHRFKTNNGAYKSIRDTLVIILSGLVCFTPEWCTVHKCAVYLPGT